MRLKESCCCGATIEVVVYPSDTDTEVEAADEQLENFRKRHDDHRPLPPTVQGPHDWQAGLEYRA